MYSISPAQMTYYIIINKPVAKFLVTFTLFYSPFFSSCYSINPQFNHLQDLWLLRSF